MGKGIRNHGGGEAAAPLVLPLAIPGGEGQTGQIGSRDPPPEKGSGQEKKDKILVGSGEEARTYPKMVMMMIIAWLRLASIPQWLNIDP